MILSKRPKAFHKVLEEQKSWSSRKYENLVAQMLAAAGRGLYYHTWEKESTNLSLSSGRKNQ